MPNTVRFLVISRTQHVKRVLLVLRALITRALLTWNIRRIHGYLGHAEQSVQQGE